MPLFTLGMFLSLLFGVYLPIPLHVILPLHYFTVIALILSFYAVKQRPLLSYFSLGVLLGTLVCSLFSTGFYQYDFIKGQNSQYQINGEITNNLFPVDCSINKPVCLKTLHLKPIEIDSVKVKLSFFSPILAVRTDQFDQDIQIFHLEQLLKIKRNPVFTVGKKVGLSEEEINQHFLGLIY